MNRIEKKINTYVEDNFDKMVMDLKELIKVYTIFDEESVCEEMPRGKYVANGFVYLEKFLAERGFKNWHFEPKKGDHGYLVLNPKPNAKTVMFISHFDVVPITDKEKWVDKDGLKGTILNDYLYGRGSLDDKSSIISLLVAYRALEAAGVVLPYELRLFVGGDEETDCVSPATYLENNDQPCLGIVPDGEFPLFYSEKSIFNYDIRIKDTKKLIKSVIATNIYNIVPNMCEIVIKADYELLNKDFEHYLERHSLNGSLTKLDDGYVKLRIKGVSVHGMHPSKGTNAITYAFKFFNNFDIPCKILSFVTDYLHNNFSGERLNLSGYDEVLKESSNLNVGFAKKVGDEIVIGINFRYIHDSLTDDIIKASIKNVLNNYFEPEDSKIEIESGSDGFVLNIKSAKWQFVLNTYREFFDQPTANGLVSAGGTYARHFANSVCMGPLLKNYKYAAHGPNEKLPLPSFKKSTQFYANLLHRLAKNFGVL